MTPRLHLSRAVGLMVLLLLPFLFALALRVTVMAPMREERSVEVLLKEIRARRSEDLEALFSAAGYAWPPQGAVPRFALKRLPAGLAILTVEKKKRLFFRAVLPLILAENERVAKQRELLLNLFEMGELVHGSREYRLASHIAQAYGIGGDLNWADTRVSLLRRVDSVPVSLALGQAAAESAWGTSRFAREGNSLFGQWTWVRGQGLVPLERAPGKGHLVRSFRDLRSSVRAYIQNLNVSYAYARFRVMRERMRTASQPLDAKALASGLMRYSERGSVYVKEIRRLMRDNGLPAINADWVLE